MRIRYWNLADLQADSLPFPASDELHIWIIQTTHMDNLHKDHKSCAILTHILSRYLKVPETAVLLDVGPHGKPFLAAPLHEPSIYFNLSHSGDYMVIIFSIVEVGIDIEYTNRNTKIEKMARRFFHPVEYKTLLNLDACNKKKHFFVFWTIKEAFLKGLGYGLSLSTNSFYATPTGNDSFYIVAADEDEMQMNTNSDMDGNKKIQEEYSSWTLQTIPAPEDYVCTIAYRIS